MRKSFHVSIAVIVTSVSLSAGAGVAEATTPGRPGRIAYTRPVGNEGFQIFTRRTDGSGVRRLTRSGREHRHPSWSPDGKRIAWTCRRGKGSSVNLDICVMNRDGSGKIRFKTEANEAHPAFSPSGDEVAFVTTGPDLGFVYPQDHIFIRNLKTHAITQVTHNTDVSERELAWAPDGGSIAFVGLDSDRSFDLFLVEVDDGEEHKLVDPDSGVVSGVDWSPDGSELVYTQRIRDSDDEIFVIRPDGTNGRQLTRNARVPVSHPVWSPNGKEIVFLYGEGDAAACFFSATTTVDLSEFPLDMRCIRGEHFDLSWQPRPV
ncbi:MAG: hypothetical protein M3N53_14005 [Actinomycetota bacterium]|nr:hypothetical protein [Actinomycetota bacterium]